jgi:hypothetical protein
LIAEKKKFLYAPFMPQTKRNRMDAVWTGRGRYPGTDCMTKTIRAKGLFRKVECNALKSHDSRVNKRVKSSAERASNACRTRAE